MFCPQCRSEYREGYTECSDCKIALVSELPPEPDSVLEYVELVTVLATGNPATIAIAKSILQEAEIQHHVKGEGLQDLFGAGRIGSGFNIVTGPAEIQVGKDDEERARKVLEDLEEDSSENAGEDQ